MNIMRESIFHSAIRSFFNTLLGMVGVVIGLLVLAIFFLFSSKPYNIQDQTTITILPDEKGVTAPLGDRSPVILQIDITQEIGTENLMATDIYTVLNASREGMFSDGRVKALFLNIDSPGGAAMDADDIYRAIMSYKAKYQVPVHAFVKGLCASGAYYIACASDRIGTSPSSIIGSVGVISGPNFNYVGLMDRYGVKAKVMTEGLNKAPFLPFIKWPEGEEAKKAEEPLRMITRHYYETFVDIVTKARPAISKTALMNDYGANVYIAEKAKELGYIDSFDTTREEALAALARIAGIDENTSYQCVSLAKVKSLQDVLFQSKFALVKGTPLEAFFPAPKQPTYARFFYLLEL